MLLVLVATWCSKTINADRPRLEAVSGGSDAVHGALRAGARGFLLKTPAQRY